MVLLRQSSYQAVALSRIAPRIGSEVELNPILTRSLFRIMQKEQVIEIADSSDLFVLKESKERCALEIDVWIPLILSN